MREVAISKNKFASIMEGYSIMLEPGNFFAGEEIILRQGKKNIPAVVTSVDDDGYAAVKKAWAEQAAA